MYTLLTLIRDVFVMLLRRDTPEEAYANEVTDRLNHRIRKGIK